jgi:FAD/FMN-containing dehydrogenase
LAAARALLQFLSERLDPMTASTASADKALNQAQRPVVQALVAALPKGTVILGGAVTERSAGIWRSDQIQAQVLVRPKTTEEVSCALRICHEHHQSVVPHGGLTGLVEGALTQPLDIVLSTERLNVIEEISASERTMVVQAGVMLQSVQEAAASEGLMFPLDLGSRGSCTLGGNLSTNAGGNRVIRYGMARDMVLGLEAVMADGTVISSMNRMIKNNAGYDLKQWFLGTEGTLGIITRAVLRCREEVTTAPTALVAINSFDALVAFLKQLDRGLAGNLSAFEVMWQNFYQLVTQPPAPNQRPLQDDAAYYVLVEAMGAAQEQLEAILEQALEAELIVDAVVSQSSQQTDQLWGLRDDVAQTFQFSPVFLFDVSLRLSEMARYVDAVNAGLAARFDAPKNFVLGHVGDGNLHFAIAVGGDSRAQREGVEAAVYEPLKAIQGSVSAEHGVGLEKKPYLHFVRDEAEIQLMRTIKAAMDPRGILNPGKIF